MHDESIDEALSGAQAAELLSDLSFRIDLLELGDLQTFAAFGLFFELFDGLELHERAMSITNSTEKTWMIGIPS